MEIKSPDDVPAMCLREAAERLDDLETTLGLIRMATGLHDVSDQDLPDQVGAMCRRISWLMRKPSNKHEENVVSEMKNYVGVKSVQARPMTRGEYNRYRGWAIPVNENPGDLGFLIVHLSGLRHWLPKEEFRSQFFCIGDDPTSITLPVLMDFRGKVSTFRIGEKTTFVKAEMLSGFMQYETSSCVDSANYDEEIGEDICIEKINDSLWGHLGFVLQWARNGLTHEPEEK
ncbi:MAG: Gp49 family protein [Sphaerochaetaceae bacterium]